MRRRSRPAAPSKGGRGRPRHFETGAADPAARLPPAILRAAPRPVGGGGTWPGSAPPAVRLVPARPRPPPPPNSGIRWNWSGVRERQWWPERGGRMAGRRGLCRLLLLLCALLAAATPAGERRSASRRRRVLEPPARLRSAGDGLRALVDRRPAAAGWAAGGGAWGGQRCRGPGAAGLNRADEQGFRLPARLRGARSGLVEVPAESKGFGKLGPVAVELPGAAGRGAAGRPPSPPGGGKQLDGQAAGLGFQPPPDSWGARRRGGGGRWRTAGLAGCPRGTCLAPPPWLRPRRCCTRSGSRLETCLKAVYKHKKTLKTLFSLFFSTLKS